MPNTTLRHLRLRLSPEPPSEVTAKHQLAGPCRSPLHLASPLCALSKRAHASRLFPDSGPHCRCCSTAGNVLSLPVDGRCAGGQPSRRARSRPHSIMVSPYLPSRPFRDHPPVPCPAPPSPLAPLARPVLKTAGSDHGLLAESHGYLMLPFKSFVPQPSSCFPLLLCHLSSQSPSLCVCSLFFPVDPFFSFSSLHFDRAGTRRLRPFLHQHPVGYTTKTKRNRDDNSKHYHTSSP